MSLSLAAGGSGSALWYLTRGTGAVTLILLTVSLVLGVADLRWSSRRVPRFVVDGLHRTVSLLVVVMVAVHVLTSLLDSFAPIRLLDVVVPFVSAYRPVWVGLGALAFDLLIALMITSVLRARLGYRGWRAVHWLAYACWPVAFVHGLGAGSDINGGWMLVVSLACAAAVAIAVLTRVASGWPGHMRLRLGAVGALAAAAIGLAVWLPSGPLARGWARRAGTPASDLTTSLAAGPQGGSSTASAAGSPHPTTVSPTGPLTTSLSGHMSQVTTPDGNAVVRLALLLDRGPLRDLAIELDGRALAGGGIALDHGHVKLGPPEAPARYHGPVSQLENNHLAATLFATGTGSLRLSLLLQVDRPTGQVRGTAQLVPVSANGAGAGG